MEIFFLACVLGIIPGLIAAKKGRSFILWWLYGAALFIIALPHAILAKPDVDVLEDESLANGMKKCPACAEMIRQEAKICRYCSTAQPESARNEQAGTDAQMLADLGIVSKRGFFTTAMVTTTTQPLKLSNTLDRQLRRTSGISQPPGLTSPDLPRSTASSTSC